MTTEERFERIEQTLDRVGQRMDQIGERMDQMSERMDPLSEGHIELETAQNNLTATLTRFIDETRTRGKEVDERIANLTILVDRLVERDLGRSNGGL